MALDSGDVAWVIAATALVIEVLPSDPSGPHAFEVLGTRLLTRFSNNIRNNFGFLNRCELPPRDPDELLFVQDGRQVFKEVVPIVSALITRQLGELGIEVSAVKCFWLHQANLAMNELIPKLKAITDARGGMDERIYMRADKKADYGTVARVMGQLSGAGFKRLALVTEVEQGS